MSQHLKNIAIVRNAVVKAVPEIQNYTCQCFDGCHITGRHIRLADILLAIGDDSFVVEAKTGMFLEMTHEGGRALNAYWNLRADSLDDQSPEFVQSIVTLLGKE